MAPKSPAADYVRMGTQLTFHSVRYNKRGLLVTTCGIRRPASRVLLFRMERPARFCAKCLAKLQQQAAQAPA